jgi:transglutaminase-like putative cysteine protease
MKRRDFLKISAAAGAVAALPARAAAADAPWRSFEVTTRVEVLKAQGVSRVWLPVPAVESPWQKRRGNAWSGNAVRAGIVSDGKYGVDMLYAEWQKGERSPVVELTSRFMTRDRAVDLSRPAAGGVALSSTEVAFYTAPTELLPTDGIVRDTARALTRNARSDLVKARDIYEWVVENTYRDPKTPGCGYGDIKTMLETKTMGGKCADINAMFVGLARAVGIPARDVYGIRVAPSALGYASLGAASDNISKAQHCRAEFFAQGYGWVPVDPGDVRKVILEEPPGRLELDDRRVIAARNRLFGSWEMNWLAYNTGHDIVLPNSSGGTKLPYLMYPNGETGGERLSQLDPDAFKYTITRRELKA